MSSVILLKKDDNVLIACRELLPQEVVTTDAVNSSNCKGSEEIDNDITRITVKQLTPVGFKIARMALKKGTLIIKYGVPIGKCILDVEPGEIIHVHNLNSQYIPSHQRGGHLNE